MLAFPRFPSALIQTSMAGRLLEQKRTSRQKICTNIFYAWGICRGARAAIFHVKTARQQQNKFVVKPNFSLASLEACFLRLHDHMRQIKGGISASDDPFWRRVFCEVFVCLLEGRKGRKPLQQQMGDFCAPSLMCKIKLPIRDVG